MTNHVGVFANITFLRAEKESLDFNLDVIHFVQ